MTGGRTPRVLSKVLQLIKLMPRAATWSNRPSNCWDNKLEVRLSFQDPTVDGNLCLIFNDLDLINEKM